MKNKKNKKLLITGGGGYIGSIICLELLKNGYQLVIIDNLSTGYKQPIKLLQKKYGLESVRFYKKDLRDNLDNIFTREKNIEAVIHVAGFCSVDESMKNPSKYFSNNTMGSYNLLDTMIRFSTKKIIFSSSCSVYGDIKTKKYDENSPLNPASPYGESKLHVEQMIQWYSKLNGLQYIILRYFNVCGADEKGTLGDSRNPSQLLVHNAILGVLKMKPFYLTYPEFDTPDKSPIRDFINVLDLADAHLKSLMHLNKEKNNLTLNLGSGVGYSVIEIVKKVEEITGAKIPLHRSGSRLGEYPRRVASIKKAEKLLSWDPKRTLDDSITSSALWYKKSKRWIK
jgi:UDP-glucose 4-epimerase